MAEIDTVLMTLLWITEKVDTALFGNERYIAKGRKTYVDQRKMDRPKL